MPETEVNNLPEVIQIAEGNWDENPGSGESLPAPRVFSLAAHILCGQGGRPD